MAGLALELEVVRVEADVRVVAIRIVEPNAPMVDDLSGLDSARLAKPAVNGQPFVYVRITGASPRLRFIELFLVYVSRPPSAPAYPMPASLKNF